MLLSFLCAWMNVTLLCLDVHGGTTEADILQIFDQAAEILESRPEQKSVFVFLDEINPCSHMGLITERSAIAASMVSDYTKGCRSWLP
jgi:hypothetical protein